MKRETKVSLTQIALLALGSALLFPSTILPILNSPPSNQDVWISLLLSYVYIIILNTPLLILMNVFRGLNINQTWEMVWGKVMGKVLILPIALFFFFCLTACTLIITNFIISYLYQNTPAWAIFLFLLLPAAFTAYQGPGTIGRIATNIVPFTIVIILLMFAFGFEKMHLRELLPIMSDSTIGQINAGAFFTGARYSEIYIFMVFSFWVRKDKSVNKAYASSLALFAVCFSIMLLSTILTLGVNYAKITVNPYYTFARQVEAFEFLERLQALILIAWVPVAVLKITAYKFMGSFVLSNIFKNKGGHRPFVLPLSVGAFAVGSIPLLQRSSTIVLLISDSVFPYFLLPVVFIIPAITVVAYLVRKKKIDAALGRMRERASDGAEMKASAS
jgi:spore germination protein KB